MYEAAATLLSKMESGSDGRYDRVVSRDGGLCGFVSEEEDDVVLVPFEPRLGCSGESVSTNAIGSECAGRMGPLKYFGIPYLHPRAQLSTSHRAPSGARL